VWKRFLKGFFDLYADQVAVMVTGSSRLDIYKRGGDSLMGRYLPYRIHPFSVGELIRPASIPKAPIKPKKIPDQKWQALLNLGGYPEPLLKGDPHFARSWRRLRMDRLVKGDLRDLSGLRELGQIEVLAKILESASGAQLVYSNLASEISTSTENVRRWVEALSSLHLGFLIRPWHKNVRRSLRKEPKWFLRDWSGIEDPGARAETMAACHLLKSVDAWNDLGLGDFALHYVRDKEKREVDFLLVRNAKPWVLIEVKAGSPRLSENLGHFHSQLGTAHALQLNFGDPYDGVDGFSKSKPMSLSARSFFSQIA
jgi:predicted AAA+ superfamily ATPase